MSNLLKKKTFFGVPLTPARQHALIIAGVIASVLVIGGAAIATLYYRSEHAVVKKQIKNEKTSTPQYSPTMAAAPAELPRAIDGLLVPADQANQTPTCVMIENADFGGVRPQSGLASASVVYEMLVEGGITRFMAVYPTVTAAAVGPVRSSRDSFLEFASEYHCMYVHAGGSITALQHLFSFEMRDVDALREPGFFYRDPKKYAPHNLFTSGEQLTQALTNHLWDKEPRAYTPWKFIDALDSAERPDPASEQGVSKIHIGFDGGYVVEYLYNSEKNAFERYNGGVLQQEATTGEVILVRNVVIQFVGPGEYHEKGRVNWPITGASDRVEIFHDGQIYQGTWKKTERTARTIFINEFGADIPLTRGNTWVEIVPPSVQISYE